MLAFQISATTEKFKPQGTILKSVPVKQEKIEMKRGFEAGTSYSAMEDNLSMSARIFANIRQGSGTLQLQTNYRIKPGSKLTDWKDNLGLGSSLYLPAGSIGAQIGLGGLMLDVMGYHGLGLNYSVRVDELINGNPELSLVPEGGPLGNSYSIFRLGSEIASKSISLIGGYAGLKAAGDFIYSGVKNFIGLFWPKIKEQDEPPDKKTAAKVLNGEADIFECLQVLQYSKGGDDNRKAAGSLLEKLLLYDLAAVPAEKNLLGISDWDRLIGILEKNKEYLHSEIWAEIRKGVDFLRLNENAVQTAKFVEDMQRKGGIGGFLAGLAGGIFNFQEFSVGLPLNLRWQGWNLPGTVWETAKGWVEDAFQFKQTKKASGFFGKIFGVVQDVVGDVLGVAGKIIGSVIPLYSKSDARLDDVRMNATKSVKENENLLDSGNCSGSNENTIYSNMLYLSRLLPALQNAGDTKIADKIETHLKKYELYYELLACRRSRMEIEAAANDLNEGKFSKGKKGEEEKLALGQKLTLQLARLSESYVYLKMTASNSASGLASALEGECKSIEELLAKYGASEENKQLLKIVQSLKSGEMTKHWKTVLQLISKGIVPDFSNFEKQDGISKTCRESIMKIYEAYMYSRKYGVLHSYFKQWTEGQDGKYLESAIGQLTLIPDGKEARVKFGSQLDWLTIMDRMYGKSAGVKESDRMEQTLDKRLDDLSADADEIIDNGKKRLDFLQRLATLSGAISRLSMLENPPVEHDRLCDWAKGQIADAIETLYEVTESLKKSNPAAYSQMQNAWYEICNSLTEEMRSYAFDNLSSDEVKVVQSMLEGYAGKNNA